jgi:hypothetical protein
VREYTVTGLLASIRDILQAMLVLILLPLIAVGAVVSVVAFWLYLVVWCKWRGGPE